MVLKQHRVVRSNVVAFLKFYYHIKRGIIFPMIFKLLNFNVNYVNLQYKIINKNKKNISSIENLSAASYFRIFGQ